MDSDYEPVLIRDPRLNDIESSIKYSVYSGSPSSTWGVYNSNGTTSKNNCKFNVQFDENTAIDKRMYFEAKVQYKITRDASNAADTALLALDTQIFNPGVSDAWQSFPLN